MRLLGFIRGIRIREPFDVDTVKIKVVVRNGAYTGTHGWHSLSLQVPTCEKELAHQVLRRLDEGIGSALEHAAVPPIR